MCRYGKVSTARGEEFNGDTVHVRLIARANSDENTNKQTLTNMV